MGQKERKTLAVQLKTKYLAASRALEPPWRSSLTAPSAKIYPAIARSWQAHLEQVIPFPSFSIHVDTAIYTTNAIESRNAWMRRALVTRGHFVSEHSATKVLFIALALVGRQLNAPAPY